MKSNIDSSYELYVFTIYLLHNGSDKETQWSRGTQFKSITRFEREADGYIQKDIPTPSQRDSLEPFHIQVSLEFQFGTITAIYSFHCCSIRLSRLRFFNLHNNSLDRFRNLIIFNYRDLRRRLNCSHLLFDEWIWFREPRHKSKSYCWHLNISILPYYVELMSRINQFWIYLVSDNRTDA